MRTMRILLGTVAMTTMLAACQTTTTSTSTTITTLNEDATWMPLITDNSLDRLDGPGQRGVAY